MFANGYQRIYHFHLKKCGGTSLNSWLALHAPLKLKWLEDSSDPYIADLTNPENQLNFASIAFYKSPVVYSHRSFIDKVRPNTFCFTVVRDPIQRLISQVADWRRESASDHSTTSEIKAALTDAGRLDLGEFLAKHAFGTLKGFFQNHQVRALASTAVDPKWTAKCDESLLALALDAANNKYDLVGVTERMHETQSILCSRLGLVPGLTDAERKNVTKKGIISADEIDQAMPILTDLTKLDQVLYDFASKNFSNLLKNSTPYSEKTFEDDHVAEALYRIRPSSLRSGISITVSDVLLANGVHGRDGTDEDSCNVWTGPGGRSVLYMPSPKDQTITVKIYIRGYASTLIRSQLRFEVNNRPVAHRFTENAQYADTVEIDVFSDQIYLKVTVLVAGTHSEVGDLRYRGVAIGAYSWTLPEERENLIKLLSIEASKPFTVVQENLQYYGDLFTVLPNILSEIELAFSNEIMAHVEYLAEKAQVSSQHLLKGGQFNVRSQVLDDAITNINAVIARANKVNNV